MPNVTAETLRRYVAEIFEGHGVSGSDAALVAENLVDADLRGVESHGVNLVSLYCTRLDTGVMNARAEVSVVHDDGTTAMLHGGLGLGQIAGVRAMELAIAKAKEHGTAAVGVRESTHLGALAFYTERAARAGCCAIAVQNGPTIVPPFGGLTGIFSTNPFSFAAPAGEEYPLVLDMATTAVAGNRIVLARKKNQEIPDWWATDADGNKTTDPHQASLEHLQWFGGYKGFGLAMMVEILSGVLMSASFGRTELTEATAHGKARVAKGYLFLVLDVNRFLPEARFRGYMDTLIRDVRSCEPARGVDRIYVPGEIEHLRKAERLRDGIPLDAALVAELESRGTPVGLGPISTNG